MSATAYSYPGFTIAPKDPNLPVRGIEAPISMNAGATGFGAAVGAGVPHADNSMLITITTTNTIDILDFIVNPPFAQKEFMLTTKNKADTITS
jgi:hypothetical protein